MSANKGLSWWSPSTAGGTGLIPTGGTKIPQATWQDQKSIIIKSISFKTENKARVLSKATGSSNRNMQRRKKHKARLVEGKIVVNFR